ncbi:MAG: cation-transporting P-type ATPase, partial [Gemmatimonadales bacterium]
MYDDARDAPCQIAVDDEVAHRDHGSRELQVPCHREGIVSQVERRTVSPSPEQALWHARTLDEVLGTLDVSSDRGLSHGDACRRLKEHGPNRLQETEGRSWWRIFLDQFRSIVVYLLAAAAVLAFATQRWPEGFAVLAVIVVNTAIGFVSELKAVRSMAALRRMGEHTALVRRDGGTREVAAADLVPGDIVLVGEGDLVPADLRLIATEHLRVNEAPLTGESVPVDKTTDPVAEDAALADRRDMLYKGTSVAAGSAEGVAVATGTDTELGRIAELAEQAEAGVAPLQQRLNDLGRLLAWITVGIGIAVALVGLVIRRQEMTLVVETALALGIAAIPEGLPIVATIALARGMYLMARRNALVNRLTAVETLGATRVIFTDKTGTLTENCMRLRAVVTPAGERQVDGPQNATGTTTEPNGEGRDATDAADGLVRRALETAVLCNSASLEESPDEDDPRGDPTETALLAGGQRLGIERDELLAEAPQARVEEFDPRVMMMATFHETEGGYRVAVKGAPTAVLDACDRIATDDGDDEPLDDGRRQEWLERTEDLAGDGLRLLALAEKRVDEADGEPYGELVFLGLVGLFDPPREDVKEAIDTCQAAGVRVEMVTGDQR